MYKKPNSNENDWEAIKKNDLFRKFRDYFIGATEKEFRQYSLYGRDGYISVNRAVEEAIFNTLENNIDEIVPIVGATGVGKTYLLLYCLETYYNVDEIPANNPVLFFKNGAYDLVYYSDFNITEHMLLKNSTELCLAKIKAMYGYLLSQCYFEIREIPDVNDYILNNKREVDYYSEQNKEYEKALFQLTNLLSLKDVPINNIIFVFDDLESLTEKQQFAFMDNFLTLFDNLKNKSNAKYCSKFLFSLRNNTYYNIYRQDFYNTHRASNALYLRLVPSLSEIFMKRFDIILKSDKVRKAKNQESWKAAKEILIKVSDRVDSSYANLLLRLNNNNISKTLDDFLNIISNRRWTQKNMNPTASFKIESEDYYINDTNILRILSIGERKIYYQTTTTTIRCVLPNPGASEQGDLVSYLILRAFRHNNSYDKEDHSIYTKLLSIDDIVNVIINCIIASDGSITEARRILTQNEIAIVVQSAFAYYEENRFIHKNVNPQMEFNSNKYYMLPRGEYIFDLFFSQSILFTIFRDDFLWDDQKFDVHCSYSMSFEALILEALKYDRQLFNIESKFFKKITHNKMWRSYISFFGAWSVSQSFLNGIENSIKQFYKNGSTPPDLIYDQLGDLKNQIKQLTSVFKTGFEEDTWF